MISKIITTVSTAIFICALFSCQQNGGSPSTAFETANASPVAMQNNLARDTNPPPKTHNYIVETARPADQIKQSFPYDIKVKTADEKTLNSADVLAADGKPVVMLFWLTTCYPCRMEMAAIEKQYAKWKEEVDFKLVAISTDFPQNFPNFVKRVNESNWPWEAYHDASREFRYVLPGGLNGLPQTFIINPKGEIVYHKRKYQIGDEHHLFEEIKKAGS